MDNLFFYGKLNVKDTYDLKNFSKFNESYSFSKAARMSSTHLKSNFGLLRAQLKCTTNSFSSHSFTIASVPPCSFLSLFVCFLLLLLFSFLFLLLFSLFLTLVIGIFHCLNYTLLLLHLITTHLVSHLSLSSIVFISPRKLSPYFTVLITLHYYFISL